MFEQIIHNNLIIAIILRTDFKKDGIQFFTPNAFSQQLGYMNRPKGYKIDPHTHKKLPQTVITTHEVLFIKSGRVKVGLYTNEALFIGERTLHPGDFILLASGGHSIEMIENSEIIEIKQGPHSEEDKISIHPIKNSDDKANLHPVKTSDDKIRLRQVHNYDEDKISLHPVNNNDE